MTQASLISDFITMLWLQDGLSANTQQAYRQDLERLEEEYFLPEARSRMNSSMVYAAIAALDCWKDAGFEVPEPLWSPAG